MLGGLIQHLTQIRNSRGWNRLRSRRKGAIVTGKHHKPGLHVEENIMSRRMSAAFLAILFAGCSGNSPSPSVVEVKDDSEAAKGRDSCTYLTLADVQETYGPTMKKSEKDRSFSGPSNDVSICTYEGGEPFAVATMMATWSKMDNPMASRDAYAASAEQGVPEDLRKALAVEKVEFQGLPALWQTGQLKVFKNGVMLSILADAAPGKNARQTIEAFMSKAITRL